MNIRHATLAAVLSTLCGVAGAQGFSSVSGPVPPQDRSVPAIARPAPVVVGNSDSQPAAQAFSSVSTPQSVATNAGAAAGAGPSLPYSGAGPSSAFEIADRIVIEKGARRLRLLRGGQVIGEYPVKLGLNPYGRKQREGDFRTPEGTYHLSRRNPRSEFFLSVEVSYPNEADRARASAEGLRPGGLIMIHGQPNVPRKPPEYYATRDWTDGCIAVSNAAMVEIWQRTRIGIPIEIRP